MKYQVESLLADWNFVEAAGSKCWEEVDQMKGSLDYCLDKGLYRDLEGRGMIKYYTISTDDGVKVGFANFVISPSLHNKGKFTATSDCMYVEPEYRGCMTELLTLVLSDMKEEGISWFSLHVKSWIDKSGKLGKSLGCELYENVYQRYL